MVKVASILACMLMLSSIVPLGCAQPAEEPRPEFIEIVSQTISAEQGGTITITEEDSFEHAGFELYIPPGALDSDQEITVGEIARADLPSLPEQYMSIGYEFFLGPSGLSLSSPATVRIPLTATVWQVCRNLASAEDFTLMKYDYTAGTWMALPTQVNNMGVITAEIEHFCFILPVLPPPSLIDPILFPPTPPKDKGRKAIEQQARDWLPPDAGEGYLQSRLDAKRTFIGDDDLTFADLITVLLLTEERWEKVKQADFHNAKSLVDIVLEDLGLIGLDAIKFGFEKAFGIPSGLGPEVTIGGWLVEYAFESAHADTFNIQLVAYLSWRGWLWDKGDRTWTFDPERQYSTEVIMAGGKRGFGPVRYANGPFLMAQTKGLDVKIGAALFPDGTDWDQFFNDFGPSLYDFLNSVNDSSLRNNRDLLRKSFAGEHDHPLIELAAPNSAVVGQQVTLGAEIEVGLIDRITITDGETGKLGDRPVVWEWRKTAGPSVDFDKHSLKQDLTFATPGEYEFLLLVWDTLWLNNAGATVSITVAEAESGQYSLSISSTAGGSVTTPYEGSYPHNAGTEVSLVATPVSGYRFVNWTGDVGAIASVNAKSTTITMNDNYSIEANFEKIDEVTYHTLTTTASPSAGGSVSPSGGTFAAGTQVTLTATQASGYTFSHWGGDASGSQNTVTVTMNSNKGITAYFEQTPPTQYTLTISSTSGGLVTTPGEGAFAYDDGTVVGLVASPTSGYHFVNWTGSVGTIASVDAESTTITMNGNYSVTANFEEGQAGEVYFADPNLETAIRKAIGKPEGPIYPSDLEALTLLDASFEDISDLTGLEHCTSLTKLDLRYNRIGDISPLAGLTGLRTLELTNNRISDVLPLTNLTSLIDLELRYNRISNVSPLAGLTVLKYLRLTANQISDVSPLAGLTDLKQLNIDDNQISDVSYLSGLTRLEGLYLSINKISDIAHLAGLTGLQYLNLRANQISDISHLVGLTNLRWIGLSHNQISDVSPLVDNEGLAKGDSVDLLYNPLSEQSINEYIPALQARGVSVDY